MKTPEDEDSYSFKIQMTGRTGKMRKTKDKNQYHKIIDSKTRKLTKKDNLTASKLENILKPAFKEIVLAIHLNKHKDLLPKFKKEVKHLDSQIQGLNLREKIEEYESSFTQLILTTNLQKTSKNPFITIYDNEEQKIGTWRHGVEIELPEGEYTIEAITNNETKEKEIELEEPETLHFDFNLDKEEDEKDSKKQNEKILEEERQEKRKDKDFIKAGSKSKTDTSNKPTKITTKRNPAEKTSKRRNKNNTSIKKAVFMLAAAIIAAYILSTIL